MFIFLCLCAQAFALESVLSDYVNDYNRNLEFRKGIITGMASVHDNDREDRRWRFYYVIPDGFRCAGGQFSRGNQQDEKMDFKCPPNHAISGFKSRHIKSSADREWQFSCCALKGTFYYDYEVRLTEDINSYDGPMDFKCSSTEVLVGLKSRHNNHWEDRVWNARCATLLLEGQVQLVGEPSLTGYVNSYDGKLDYTVESGFVMTGLKSKHHNWYEDRVFQIYYASLDIPCHPLGESAWVNSYDKKMDFKCSPNSAMIGIKSVHHNWYEDRRFIFRCCDLSNRGQFTIRPYLTDYVNSMNEAMDETCPQDEVLVGLNSWHHDYYEDRKFRFYCGTIFRA